MCGICGVVDWSDSSDAAAIARRMTPTMFHRGPDDEGYLETERVALGMRRLSIIDLAGGHQPIFNEDGKVGVVLNGEIYNFKELRARLKDRGHAFRTRSDSEVIAHAYEEWGKLCVERLEGMFAFAVYDRRAGDEGELFIARDRLGIKPLYYYAQSGPVQRPTSNVQSFSKERGHGTLDVGPWTRFLFASEVRTLLASGLVPRILSRAALESYLLFGSVSEPMTLVDGVLSLPPGHTLTINLNSPAQTPIPHCYWKAGDPHATNGHHKTNFKDAVAAVGELLEESVRKHLIADVPVGVFLSSGIDSTSLAALASQEVSGVHTFTVAFPEKEFNEATIAAATAAKLGTTHEEVMLSGDDMLAHLGDAVSALDEPSIDGINTYFVSWSARQAGLKVALSGLGGDEVFGGYHTFRRTARFQRMAAVSRVPGLSSIAASVAEGAGGHFLSGDAARKMAALLGDAASLPDPFYFGRALFTPDQVSGLLKSKRSSSERPLWWQWLSESSAQANKLDSFGAVSCMELQSYLVSTLLRDTDSMSMAHSLEVRVPFLHHPLVEFIAQLPEEIKRGDGSPKSLLVAALGKRLPAEVVEQKKKGFTFPWANWLRGPLKKDFEQGLSELAPGLQETMNAETAQSIWSSYLDGNTTWSRPWSLYVLNEWAKKHLA